jgi:MFS family permease
MLDMGFWKNPRFSGASGAIAITFFAMFGSIFLLTQYLQFVLGYTPFQTGIRLLAFAIPMMVIAPFSPRVVDKIGTKFTVALGLVCVSVGLVLLGGVGATTGFADIAWRMALMATGMALTMSPATESIMGSLPLTRAGVGSAVNDATRQVGGAVGVAVIGSVFSSIYGSRIVAALRGKPVPASVVAAAKSSLGAALQAAGHFPGTAGRVFANLAKTAFIDGFHSGVYVGAAGAAIGIIAVLIWLPAHARADDVERQAADFDRHGVSGPPAVTADVATGEGDASGDGGDGVVPPGRTPART